VNKVPLGSKAKDTITGFSGVVTGFCEYISGCNQVLLTPPVDKDGGYKSGQWFDVQRVERVDDSLVVLDNSETPGCDIPAPVR
jgi:hypothetical protein